MGPDHGPKHAHQEIREGRATYYIVPFEFLDESIDFSNLTFSPKERDCVRAQNQSAALAPGLKMAPPTMPRLIIASHNTGKIREFTEILSNHWEISPQGDHGVPEVVETGTTFVENALIKARHACRATGCAALADDSGLVVPALGGVPGCARPGTQEMAIRRIMRCY